MPKTRPMKRAAAPRKSPKGLAPPVLLPQSMTLADPEAGAFAKPSPRPFRYGVRIPRSSPRSCQTDYAKLLRSVDPNARCGFGFEGVLLRPGSMVWRAELWPTDEYPRVPLLLEAALVPSEEPAAQRRMEQLYVLWRYNPDHDTWAELGHARSEAWHWALELRGLAVRALAESRPVILATVTDLSEIQKRIAAVLDLELGALAVAEQWCVLGILHDQFARRVIHGT
jgi:hypothetical protein